MIRGVDPMKYKILLHKSEEGYSVSCPGLPGCWSQGETEEEAIENIKDAMQEYLVAVKEVTQTRHPDSEQMD
jgi:predicted RNase H-like HicB family nuclease